jgi:hypothetical protein
MEMGRDEFFLSWHMLVRADTEFTIRCLDSLQGLYDECIIGVDSRPDSDEIFEILQLYPHTNVYRQDFSQFGRFDAARQDVLNRVSPTATYIGWCDSDEILVKPSARKIRTFLYDNQDYYNNTPGSGIEIGIHYLGSVGGHIAGETYPRIRIWSAKQTRVWTRPVHEHPMPINNIPENNTYRDEIVFDHLKIDNTTYRADLHVDLLQKEILDKGGSVSTLFYIAREKRYKGDIEGAKQAYEEYLMSGDTTETERTIAELMPLYNLEYSATNPDFIRIIDVFPKFKTEHPLTLAWLSIALWYCGNHEEARRVHWKARMLDPMGQIGWLVANDKFFS